MKYSRRFVWAAVSIISLSGAGQALVRADDSNPSINFNQARGALRDIVSEMVGNSGIAESDETQIAQMIRAYRLDPALRDSDDANSSSLMNPTIVNGPLIGFAASTILPTIWGSTYDAQWNKNLKSTVTDATLESVFDLFINGIIDGSQDSKAAQEVGSCLAKKVKAGELIKGDDGSQQKCQLDDQNPTDFSNAPGTLSLIWVKLNCFLPFMSACHVRQKVFDAAKEQIYHEINDKEADGKSPLYHEFENDFPVQFRQELLADGNQLRAGIADLVSRKLQAGDEGHDALWDNGDTAETEEASSPRITMNGFAKGLYTDMTAAALFANSSDASLRGLSGALMYGAANRLVEIMGGYAAIWDADHERTLLNGDKAQGMFLMTGANGDDPGVSSNNPKAAPLFQVQPFGGTGLTATAAQAQVQVLQLWDISNYSGAPDLGAPGVKPVASPSPMPFEIFPSEFSLQAGVAQRLGTTLPNESLDDLAELAISLETFLSLSRPGAALGKYFGEVEDLENDLMAPGDPLIFPQEGRSLAVGLLASILKNLVDIDYGHISYNQVDANGRTVRDASGKPVLLAPGADRGGAGLAFFEVVGPNGRAEDQTRVSSVAKMLSAALGLRDLMLSGDPAVPAALLANRSVLEEAIGMTSLTLTTKQCQAADGGFYEYVNHPTASPRTLLTAVESIRALTQAYTETGTLSILQSLMYAWQFMDHFWVSGQTVPMMQEGGTAPNTNDSIDPSDMAALWDLERLWSEVQASASYSGLQTNAPGWAQQGVWVKWKTRFTGLQDALDAKLPSP